MHPKLREPSMLFGIFFFCVVTPHPHSLQVEGCQASGDCCSTKTTTRKWCVKIPAIYSFEGKVTTKKSCSVTGCRRSHCKVEIHTDTTNNTRSVQPPDIPHNYRHGVQVWWWVFSLQQSGSLQWLVVLCCTVVVLSCAAQSCPPDHWASLGTNVIIISSCIENCSFIILNSPNNHNFH